MIVDVTGLHVEPLGWVGVMLGGSGVFVRVGEARNVLVGVLVDAPAVGVRVGVSVIPAVGVRDGVGVIPTVRVRVGVSDGPLVGVFVREGVKVLVRTGVLVGVSVGVAVFPRPGVEVALVVAG